MMQHGSRPQSQLSQITVSIIDLCRLFLSENTSWQEELANDRLRSWLVDSYATLNQIQADSKLKNRVEFEDIPSGNTWLTLFLQAMRENKAMTITYQGFDKINPSSFEIEPYCLKVVRRRWYIIANCPYYVKQNRECKGKHSPYKEIRAYGLDRIAAASLLDRTFSIRKGFSMKNISRDVLE